MRYTVVRCTEVFGTPKPFRVLNTRTQEYVGPACYGLLEAADLCDELETPGRIGERARLREGETDEHRQ